MTPDEHAFRPVRIRIWQRRRWPWRWVCAAEGCRLAEDQHPEDE